MKRYRVVITAYDVSWKRELVCNRPLMSPGPCSAATIAMHRESEWAESQGNSIIAPVIYVYEVRWSANLNEYINWAPPVAIYGTERNGTSWQNRLTPKEEQ